jgi:hypothetical protein
MDLQVGGERASAMYDVINVNWWKNVALLTWTWELVEKRLTAHDL